MVAICGALGEGRESALDEVVKRSRWRRERIMFGSWVDRDAGVT